MLTNFASTVLTRYKADTSDAKQKIRELTGEQRKQAKEHLEALEKQNAGIEKHIATVAKIGAAIGAVAGGVALAKKAWAEYTEDATLRANLHGADIERIQQAAGGLITQYEAMNLVVADNNGAWDISQAQMETVATAMRSLTKQGNDQTRVFENVKKALTEGSIEPLKEFGIVIEGVSGKEASFNAFMQAMEAETKKFGGDLTNVNDDAKRSMVELKDSFRELSVALGSIINDLMPLIVAITGVVADFVSAVSSFFSGTSAWSPINTLNAGEREFLAERAKRDRGMHKFLDRSTGKMTGGDDWNAINRGFEEKLISTEGLVFEVDRLSREWLGVTVSHNVVALAKGLSEVAKQKRKTAGKGGGARLPRLDASGYGSAEFGGFIDSWGGAFGAGGDIGIGGIGGTAFLDAEAARMMEFSTRGERYAAFDKAKLGEQNDYLGGIFGPIEQFDKYAAAFGMLSGAAQSAFAAWIDGSMGVGEAMKAFAAQSMKAIASDMFGKSIQHAAYAIGMLAFGRPDQAAMHGKAAAAFGAGAIATGLIAKELGGNVSGSKPSAGQSGNGAGAGVRQIGGVGNLGYNATVVIGDDFADDSPRQRARKMARALELAKRHRGDDAVRFS